MKRKAPASPRRLPVDFGDESWFPIPIRKVSSATRKSSASLEELGGMSPSANVEASSTIRIMQYGIRAPRNSSSVPLSFWGEGGLLNHKSKFTNRKFGRAFTLVEILVVLALLGLIVFALMAVFAATQRAFRASLTQTDTLEGARSVMDLMASDLQTMTPANWQTNLSPDHNDPSTNFYAPVNFYVSPKTFAFLPSGPPSPLPQSLIGSLNLPPAQRTNVLEDLFILSKGNINGVSSWIGTGYSVNTNLADGTMYPLYRFYMTTNVSAGPPGMATIFNTFAGFQYTNSSLWSHLMDGVVNLTMRTYDTNGVWMTNGYANPQFAHVKCARFQPLNFTIEPSAVFYSNALPASVQIELGTIEDRVLAHAEGLSVAKQSNYLAGAAAQVHLFRQRVSIPNVDRTAYQ